MLLFPFVSPLWLCLPIFKPYRICGDPLMPPMRPTDRPRGTTELGYGPVLGSQTSNLSRLDVRPAHRRLEWAPSGTVGDVPSPYGEVGARGRQRVEPASPRVLGGMGPDTGWCSKAVPHGDFLLSHFAAHRYMNVEKWNFACSSSRDELHAKNGHVLRLLAQRAETLTLDTTLYGR